MELRTEEHGPHIVVVTIDNQPRRNAMPRSMMAELAELWDRLERSSCRCIVLTGAGDRAFSAGADLSGDLSAGPETARVVSHALLKQRAYSKPIVAAVNGDCIGGGLELLLSTDIRAAAPHARFGLPEVRWSIYPFGGATVKLVQQIGYVHAMDLLLTARLVDAAEAARLGLVNRVVAAERPPRSWQATARRRCRRSSSRSAAPLPTTPCPGRPWNRSWAIACGPVATSGKGCGPSSRSADPTTPNRSRPSRTPSRTNPLATSHRSSDRRSTWALTGAPVSTLSAYTSGEGDQTAQLRIGIVGPLSRTNASCRSAVGDVTPAASTCARPTRRRNRSRREPTGLLDLLMI